MRKSYYYQTYYYQNTIAERIKGGFKKKILVSIDTVDINVTKKIME